MERVSFDRNIVQYYGACLDEEVPLLVMEYMAVRTRTLYSGLSTGHIACHGGTWVAQALRIPSSCISASAQPQTAVISRPVLIDRGVQVLLSGVSVSTATRGTG
jgi:hypothetical protein